MIEPDAFDIVLSNACGFKIDPFVISHRVRADGHALKDLPICNHSQSPCGLENGGAAQLLMLVEGERTCWAGVAWLGKSMGDAEVETSITRQFTLYSSH